MLVVCVTSLNIVSSSIRLPSNFTFLYTQKTSGDLPFSFAAHNTLLSLGLVPLHVCNSSWQTSHGSVCVLGAHNGIQPSLLQLWAMALWDL